MYLEISTATLKQVHLPIYPKDLRIIFSICRKMCLNSVVSKVNTFVTQVEVLILEFKNTLVKVEVSTSPLYSSKSKKSTGSKIYLKYKSNLNNNNKKKKHLKLN